MYNYNCKTQLIIKGGIELSKWINTYDLWNFDGKLYLFKNYNIYKITPSKSFCVKHFYLENLHDMLANIAEDLILEIFGDRYNISSQTRAEDIKMHVKLVIERSKIFEEIINILRSKILYAPLRRWDEDDPIIRLCVDVRELKEILEEKLEKRERERERVE